MSPTAFALSTPVPTRTHSSAIAPRRQYVRRPRTFLPDDSSVPTPDVRRTTTGPHMMSALPAESTAAPSESDWRAFRAHLLASYRTHTSPQHFQYCASLAPSSHPEQLQHPENITLPWIHRLANPEVGAILHASQTYQWPEAFSHLRRAVIVITDMRPASGSGTNASKGSVTGLLLNRPTRFTVGAHRSVLSRVGPEFSDNRVMLGGDCSSGSLALLHSFTPADCPGATQLIPGLSHGGFNSARALVKDGRASPDAFNFYVAYAKWTFESLQAELDRGAWNILACDPAMMLSTVATVDPDRLWSEFRSYLVE